MLQAVC